MLFPVLPADALTRKQAFRKKYISGGLPPARRGPAAKLWGVPEEIYSSGWRVSI